MGVGGSAFQAKSTISLTRCLRASLRYSSWTAMQSLMRDMSCWLICVVWSSPDETACGDFAMGLARRLPAPLASQADGFGGEPHLPAALKDVPPNAAVSLC